jgi:hypothetical protein
MKIHKILINTAIVTGCLNILRSTLSPLRIFKKNNTIIPASNGSVGKKRSTGIFSFNLVSGIERGTKNTIQ